MDIAANAASLPPTAPQRLDGLTFDETGLEETSTARLPSVSRAGQLLTSELVEQARREAIADWITTGLTPGQILALQNATVQITDLNSEGAFGFAGSRLIQLDDDALGFGWHVGSGPVPTGAVDLGTVMRHELGHILGYGDLDPATAGDSIMSGTILPGERRSVPVSVISKADDPALSSSEQCGPQRIRRDDLLHGEEPGQSRSATVSLIASENRSVAGGHTPGRSRVSSAVLRRLMQNSDVSEQKPEAMELLAASDADSIDQLFSNPLECF